MGKNEFEDWMAGAYADQGVFVAVTEAQEVRCLWMFFFAFGS